MQKLRKWLQIPGNTQTRLAAELGYLSSMAIYKWLQRGQIPRNRLTQVMEIVESELSVAGKKRQNQKASSSVSLRS